MTWAMIKAYPKMLKQAEISKKLLDEIILKKNIDIVISDNRYELYSKNAYCIFITHQLNIQTPGLTKIADFFIQNKINNYIKKFNELWIPDAEGEANLSGKLSHNIRFPNNNTFFIGPLSRFSLLPQNEIVKTNDLLVLISGPEPQRTILEKKLISQALESGLATVVLQGKPELYEVQQNKNVRIISHLNDTEIAGLINSSKIVIARPGYSTMMDLSIVGSKAILIPTPGQTEQEYLAEKYLKEKLFYSEKQKNFSLSRSLEKAKKYEGLSLTWDNKKLIERIEFLSSITTSQKN